MIIFGTGVFIKIALVILGAAGLGIAADYLEEWADKKEKELKHGY